MLSFLSKSCFAFTSSFHPCALSADLFLVWNFTSPGPEPRKQSKHSSHALLIKLALSSTRKIHVFLERGRFFFIKQFFHQATKKSHSKSRPSFTPLPTEPACLNVWFGVRKFCVSASIVSHAHYFIIWFAHGFSSLQSRRGCESALWKAKGGLSFYAASIVRKKGNFSCFINS